MASPDPVFVPLPADHGAPGHGRTVLVTGATGNQGGATARHLLGAGWQVRALVRDPDSPAARKLAKLGAQPVVGDMADRESLDQAAVGVYGVFSVQGLPGADADWAAESEVSMGTNVADAAVAAGARHLVYASVAGADRDPEPWHWRTKALIEDHIRTLDLPYTFLRPVMFMENHASRGPYGAAGEVALVRVVPPASRVQMIAASDIGAFAALAFADPERYADLALELAGDEVTGDQLVEAISRAIGRPVNRDLLPREIIEAMGVDPAQLAATTRFGGWEADLPALRALHPNLLTFESWLAAGGAAKLSALFASA
jgi:uncharacterized protein YbjT (DUF2867 family)